MTEQSEKNGFIQNGFKPDDLKDLNFFPHDKFSHSNDFKTDVYYQNSTCYGCQSSNNKNACSSSSIDYNLIKEKEDFVQKICQLNDCLNNCLKEIHDLKTENEDFKTTIQKLQNNNKSNIKQQNSANIHLDKPKKEEESNTSKLPKK